MKTFSHTRPVRNEAGEIINAKPAPCSRCTVAALGGNFGPDRRRRLVVTLKAGDIVEFRPERTRQTVTMLATDLYRVALRARASRVHLEKARTSKARKAEARAARRIKAADKRITREAKEQSQ